MRHARSVNLTEDVPLCGRHQLPGLGYGRGAGRRGCRRLPGPGARGAAVERERGAAPAAMPLDEQVDLVKVNVVLAVGCPPRASGYRVSHFAATRCPVFGGAFTVRFVTFSVVMGDGTDLNPGPAAVPKLSCAPASPLPSGPPSAYHRAANLKPMPCSGSLSLAASSRLPSRLRSRLCPSVQRTPPRQVRAPPSPSERPA